MSKALKIAAVVVGVAAVIVSGGAALGLLPAVIPVLGISATALGTILSVTSTLLAFAATVTAKKPKLQSVASQLEFRADPASGIPYVMGEAMVGMDVVHQAAWGDNNKNLGLVGIISGAGPIQSFDGFYSDNTLVTFTGGNADGYYHDHMLLQTQLGARPEASALSMPGMPDWGAAYKLSSMAAVGLTLVADTANGKIFSGGTPQMTNLVHGVKAYDCREDSTNGGSGTQRRLDESTYVYSENPWVHHGTYAMGRWVNGVRVIGPGMPINGIDWPSHVEAANVADLHGWTCSGKVYSTDRKFEVLKAIAQAGGGFPVPSGTKLACLVNMPRVSLETITEKDVKGVVSAPQMTMRRDRLNGAIPRYRDPSLGWQIVPADLIRNATYLAEDGGQTRTREVEFALVTDKDQAAQLAAYAVANTRERTGIQVELGWYWSQYKVGDCLTLNLPSALLVSQKCIVIGRRLNPERNTITLEFRTEDDAKHTWALGLTGDAPAPTNMTFAPGAGDGILTDVAIQNLILNSAASGLTFDVGVPAGGNSAVTINGPYDRIYSDNTVSVDGNGGPVNVAAATGDRLWAFYDDPTRAGGAVTYQYLVLPGGVGDASSAYASPAHPYRHTVIAGYPVPGAGDPTSGGSDPGTGGGSGGGRWELNDNR